LEVAASVATARGTGRAADRCRTKSTTARRSNSQSVDSIRSFARSPRSVIRKKYRRSGEKTGAARAHPSSEAVWWTIDDSSIASWVVKGRWSATAPE
jgi:hypothetical protein